MYLFQRRVLVLVVDLEDDDGAVAPVGHVHELGVHDLDLGPVLGHARGHGWQLVLQGREQTQAARGGVDGEGGDLKRIYCG